MENSEIIFQTDFFEDDTLYEIVGKIMEKDYNSLVEWIVMYRYQKNNDELTTRFEMDFLVLKASISPLLKKYRKMLRWSKLDEACSLFKSEIYSSIESFRKKYQSLEKYTPALFSLLNELHNSKDVSSEADLIKIRELLQRTEKETKTPDFHNYLQEKTDFRKKLTNHIFLLNELIEILITEHDRRITDTRQNFEGFIVSHRDHVKKIKADMDLARDKIHKLKNDTSIPEDEKKNLLAAFTKKYNELALILKNENNRMTALKSLSENIQKGFTYLKDLITSLKDQMVQFQKREEYLESLTQIGKDIPDFKNSLESLSASLHKEFPQLKKSFLVSDRELQKKILDAIENQEVINRIVFSGSDKISEEIKIGLSGGDTDTSIMKPGEIVEIDMNIFDTIQKEET